MASEYGKKLRKEEETTSSSCAGNESLRSSRGAFADSSSADRDFKTVMSRVVHLVKKKTRVDIRFFPLSVAKLWIILRYSETPEDRLSLLKDQLVRDDLKLRSVEEEKLAKLSRLHKKKDEGWLDLNKEGFDHLTNNFLKCPSFSSIDPNSLAFEDVLQSSEFFRDFENAFVHQGNIFVSNVPKTSEETVPLSASGTGMVRLESEEAKFCRLWEKLVFLLRLYKTPINSFDDLLLWKGVYSRKFVEAKATLLNKHPKLPLSVVFLIAHLMNEDYSEIVQ